MANQPCAAKENWKDIRAAVFHAVLRVKSHIHQAVSSPPLQDLLRNEMLQARLDARGLSDDAPLCRDWLVNGEVLVRLAVREKTQVEQEAEVRELLKKLGKTIGLLVDFGKDLMVDGLVTVTGPGPEG